MLQFCMPIVDMYAAASVPQRENQNFVFIVCFVKVQMVEIGYERSDLARALPRRSDPGYIPGSIITTIRWAIYIYPGPGL